MKLTPDDKKKIIFSIEKLEELYTPDLFTFLFGGEILLKESIRAKTDLELLKKKVNKL